MKMRSLALAVASLSALVIPVSGQSLADVISSIQERKRAVEQAEQVRWHLSNYPSSPAQMPDQELIEWVGLSTNIKFPSDSDLASLGIEERLSLLNQAIHEFRYYLHRRFINLRQEDLETVGNSIGDVRLYLLEDFPEFERATASNYHEMIGRLSQSVRRLSVLGWPLAGYMRKTRIDVDSETQYTSLGAGAVEAGGQWETGILGEYSIFSGHEVENAGPNGDETRYYGAKEEKFCESVALFAKVPNRQDQVGGRVAALVRNTWSPATSTTFTSTSAVPWDPADCALHVAVSADDPASALALDSAPQITVEMEWVDVYDHPKGYNLPDGLSFPALSWEGQLGVFTSGLLPGIPHGYYVLGRTVEALFAPNFEKGLDASGKAARLDKAELAQIAPSGDGKPVLHPSPGLLAAIPLGVGLDGSTIGFVGITPGEDDDDGIYSGHWNASRGTLTSRASDDLGYLTAPAGYDGLEYGDLAYRFDSASALRFVGPAEDFHVVYETSRSESARGAALPPTTPDNQEQDDMGLSDTRFFRSWDLPRLRQVVSRGLIVDITPGGHFKNTVKVYRRPLTVAVDRTPGALVSVDGLTPIRTIVMQNPGASSDPYPDMPEKLHLTEAGITYKVWRDGYPETVLNSGGYQTMASPDIHFKLEEGGSTLFERTIEFTGATAAQITTKVDGLTSSVEAITFDGWEDWCWARAKAPANYTITRGGQTTTVANTYDSSYPPGAQYDWFPKTSDITVKEGGTTTWDIDLEWWPSGMLKNHVKGTSWRSDFSMEGGALKAVSKLHGATYATSWTEWSNNDRTVRTTSAPDGTVTTKTGSACDWSELELGSSSGTGLPGLPHKLSRKDGSGMTWDWTVNSDGSATIEAADGLLSAGSVTRGTKSVVDTNERGYVTHTEEHLLQGSNEVQISGNSTPASGLTAWGAPKKSEDFTSGLATILAHDSNRDRPTSITDAFGVVTGLSGYDALDRPGGFAWNGHTGGILTYNNGGFGMSSSIDIATRAVGQSSSWDAAGRVTGGSVTGGGTSSFSLDHAASGKTLNTSDTVTGASGTVDLRNEDGSLEDATGDALAFGGLDGTALVVDNGLIKSTASLGGLAASFQTTWTDASGRIRKSAVPSTLGTGNDETAFVYNTPASQTKRVEVQHPSGRKWIEESEPWNSSGVVVRSGLDVNGNGLLDAGDRYVTTVTTIAGSVVRTTVTQTGNPTSLMVRDYNPSSGVTTTTIHGGEEVITETPDFDAKTIAVIRKRGAVVVESSTVSLNHLGQADSTTASGAGIPSTTVDPTFRDDGSLSAFSVTIGGATSSLTFHQDGTLSGLTHPTLGVLSVNHSFAGGEETLSIDGTTMVRSLDGTETSLTGAGVMDRDRDIAVSGGGFAETIDPAAGSGTVLSSNAAGAKTLHNYAAGADTQTTWLAGGLAESVSLGRGGRTVYGYSADGARDLKTITWPGVSSAGFTNAFYGGTVTLGRDAAGHIDSIIDPSGERALDHEKNRLTSTDWLSGELDDYKVVRAYDPFGRLDLVTVWRNGLPIHSWDPVYTADSDELDGVTSGGFTADYARNAGRQLTSVTRGSIVQDWGRGTAGRITSAGSTGVSLAPSFTYSTFDAKGRRKTVATNRGTWTYAYRGGDGGDGQLISASATGNDLGTFAYSFDGIGRRSEFAGNGTDALNQFVAIDHGSGSRKLFISADPSARLWVNGTEMTPFNGGYIHDIASPGSSGGWVPWTVKGQIDGGGDPGAHADAVAELAGQVWFPPQVESFTYDADGNRESSALWDYGWDGRNRLVRARTADYLTGPEGYDLEFDYDAEGRRFKKEVSRYENGKPVDRKTIWFIWDGWDLVYERYEDSFGNLLMDRKYVWGADISGSRGGAGGAGGLLLMRETRGQTTEDYYPLYDGTGHVVALADSTGDKVAEYWYGPFGELIEASGELADANPWRYASKYYDKETGLYYFGRRYFDPVTGQWLSREPLGEDESLNLYAYCGSDPVNKVDVLGLREKTIVSPDPLNRFRRGANGEWEVRLVDIETGFLGNRSDFVRDKWVSTSSQSLRLSGYCSFNEQGGVLTSGSEFIQATAAATGWDENAQRDLTLIAGGSMTAMLTAPYVIATSPAWGTAGYVQASNLTAAGMTKIGAGATLLQQGYQRVGPLLTRASHSPTLHSIASEGAHSYAIRPGSMGGWWQSVRLQRGSVINPFFKPTPTGRASNWFGEVARNATRNANSNSFVLGHFAREGTSYQKVAAHYNSTYFKVDDWNAVTKGLSQSEIWRINETFLTQQLSQGKQVLFSHNPLKARSGSFFEKEVNFMRELGYSFRQKNQWTWEAFK